MSLEVKSMTLKTLDERGEGAALFALWDIPDLEGDIHERGYFGHGTQEVFMLAHHLMQSGQPPLAKGVIYEEAEGAVYRFRMNTATDQGRNWHQHFLFDLKEGNLPRQVWSYGFRVKPDGFTPRADGFKGRRLHATREGQPGVIVLEVSPVTAAAQPLSRTLTAKTDGPPLTRAQNRHFAELEKRLHARMAERKAEEQLAAKQLRLRFLERQIELTKRRAGV
jgi:hypothetical protein